MSKLAMMDFSLLALESEESPKHMAALQLFEIPGNYRGDFAGDVLKAYRDSPVSPPFNQKLEFPRVGLPSWVDAPDLDPDYHITRIAVPEPGGMDELVRLVTRLNLPLLDRKRPLWEYYLIDGLKGRRIATFFKVHHACIDGMLASMRMQASLTHTPEDKTIVPFWAPLPDVDRQRTSPVDNDGLVGRVKAAADMVSDLPGWIASVASVGRMMLLPPEGTPRAPQTPFNGVVNATRSVALQTLPLEPMKQLGKKTGATVNDIILTCVDGSVSQYLEARGIRPATPLVAGSPISVRPANDSTGSNEVAMMQVALGTPEADPATRLQQVLAATSQAKADLRSQPREVLKRETVLGAAITAVLDQLQMSDRFPQANILVSNVVGNRSPLYLNGARLVGSFALPVLIPGMAINFTLITREDKLDFGITACRDMVPDVQELADGISTYFEALQQALGAAKPARKQKSRTRKKPKSRAAPKQKARSAQSGRKASSGRQKQ